jgi:crotonobetainyl-CoA:carnitine CoA-transferase CaiB-like acyl-CoA transferase
MNALIGIQQALLQREKTGRGTGVKISLFDTAADWMTVPLLHTQYGKGAPKRVGMHHPSIAPYGGYRTADGETLAISIQNEREWVRFCERVLLQPELATDAHFRDNNTRVKHRIELDTFIKAVFSSHSRSAMESLLREADIAFGAVNTPDGVIRHPQLKRRRVTLPEGGSVNLVASPVQFSDKVDAQPRDGGNCARVPKVGEHSRKIRREFSASVATETVE